MSRRSSTERSVKQRVGNAGRERKLIRIDAFAAYVMDRLLYRLGRSSHADEFYLKGGVLVANMVDEPYRFTRDIDLLRRKGPPDPDEIRGRFEARLVRGAHGGPGAISVAPGEVTPISRPVGASGEHRPAPAADPRLAPVHERLHPVIALAPP